MLNHLKLHWWIYASIAVLAVVIGSSYALPIYGEICGKDEYSNHEECSREHIATVAFWQIGKWADSASAVITALATALLTVITWGLVVVAREQTKSTQAQLRAYVFPDNILLWDGTNLNPQEPPRFNQPGVIFIWKNTGLTPAINVVSWARISIIKPQNEGKLFVPPALRPEHANTLGANQGGSKALWYKPPFKPLSAHALAEILAGRLAIYFYGRIEYLDVFENKRWTNFRFSFMGKFPLPGNGCVFNVSQKGNDHS